VLRVVGRMHAALNQRQAASGMQVRSRYKRLRSRGELAASQASRFRRQASYQAVATLYQQGKSMAAIVEQLHLSPTTVRKYVYAGAFPERATHTPRARGSLASICRIWSGESRKAATMPVCCGEKYEIRDFPRGTK
jgi:hypothetical protein